MPLDHAVSTAIVGAGLMGEWHARYASRCGARIAAIVDPDLGRAEALAARYRGAAPYAGLDDCLSGTRVQAAHICAPTNAHFALCSQTLGTGIHTLVEKPATGVYGETETLLDIADRGALRFGVSLQLPFQEGFEKLLSQRVSLGDVVRVEFRAATAGGDGRDAEGRRQVLWEMLPHPLSVFVALFGSSACEADWRVDRFDVNELELSTRQDDAPCAIQMSLRERPRTLQLDWRGSRGRAHVDFYHGYASIHRGSDTRSDKVARPLFEAAQEAAGAGTNLARRAARGEPAYPGLRALIERFHRSIDGGPALQPPAELLAIARIAEAVRAGATA